VFVEVLRAYEHKCWPSLFRELLLICRYCFLIHSHLSNFFPTITDTLSWLCSTNVSQILPQLKIICSHHSWLNKSTLCIGLFSSTYTCRVLFKYPLLYSYILASLTVALPTMQQAFVVPLLLFSVSLTLYPPLSFLCQITSLIHTKVSLYKVLITLFKCGTASVLSR